jgi:transposase
MANEALILPEDPLWLEKADAFLWGFPSSLKNEVAPVPKVTSEKELKEKPKGHLRLWQVVFGHKKSYEVRMHCVYCVFFLGISIQDTTILYASKARSIYNWIKQFRDTGDVDRKKVSNKIIKYTENHHSWIEDYVLNVDPLAFLHEIKAKFQKHFALTISESTISRILRLKGITLKVIEERAMQIRFADISRFTLEVNTIFPLPCQLLFLDEMSLDNRHMQRKKGWFLRGKRLLYRGFFKRSERISILAFLGSQGVVDVFRTDGTFDRLTFFDCCRKLLKSGKVSSLLFFLFLS